MKLPLSPSGPDCALPLLASPVFADVDFVKEIKPIIEQSCIRCHSGDKAKGGFSMETKALFERAARRAKSVVPGKSAESRLYKMVMAQGRRHPHAAGRRAARQGGHRQDQGMDRRRRQVAGQGGAIKAPAQGSRQGDRGRDRPADFPAEKAAVEKLEKAGVFVMRLAQNTNWLRVDFTHRGKDVKDDELILLKDCPNLVELNLGGLTITDAQTGASEAADQPRSACNCTEPRSPTAGWPTSPA